MKGRYIAGPLDVRIELAALELFMIREDEGGPSEGDVQAAAADWCLQGNRADYEALVAALTEKENAS